MEFTLVWAALTGVGFAWVGIRIWNHGLPDHAMDRLTGGAAAGLLIGRLAAMISQGTNPLVHPGDILLVRGGVHTAAATAGAMGAYMWSVKGHVPFLDAVAPAALLGLAGWHAGCLWRGACLGTATNLPWGWSVPASSVDRHPVELYAAAGLIVAAVVVSRAPMATLLRSGSALGLASLVLLATEPLRLTLAGGPAGWYIAGIAVGIALPITGRRLHTQPYPHPT